MLDSSGWTKLLTEIERIVDSGSAKSPVQAGISARLLVRAHPELNLSASDVLGRVVESAINRGVPVEISRPLVSFDLSHAGRNAVSEP